MSAFDAIRAQAGPIDILRRAVAGGRVASSYLFEGPSGVGKQLSAVALAKEVLGADEAAVRRIDAGAHPDVRVFGPRDEGRRNIPVEQLREQILPVAQFAPFEASAAFLIFPEADVSFPEHPSESANALLKTLEEPRPGVHFVLLSERPDRLLPTIRSRCQRVRFGRLPPSVLESLLSDLPVEARGPAIALADGRADRARALGEGEATALFELALEVDEATAVGGPGTLVQMSERIVRGDLALGAVLDALIAFYRDVAAVGLGLPDEALGFKHRANDLRARAARVGPSRAAERAYMLGQAQIALERNGNPQVVVDALLYEARV